MADIVKEATEYRIKQIELAEAQYYKSLINTLDRIEREVVASVSRLPLTDGKLVELQSAIAIRPQIKNILEKEYLAWSDTVVREGFNKQAKRIEKAFKRIGNIPVEFQELTKGDLALIQNLKQQYFTQFKDVSNTFTRRLSEKVYQNTLIGSEFATLEKELRQTINGIYASSDDPEINRLVEFVNENKFVESKSGAVDKAIQTLQSKFARDRAGENMKKYAGQILNDSLRDFDATLNFNKSQDAGLTYVKYYGDVIPTTRTICRNVINGVYDRRKGGLFTVDEVRRLWANQSWSGKKSGDPLIVRGGYNCRHQWSYVNPDWYDEQGELII
jgi:hypothetical protein